MCGRSKEVIYVTPMTTHMHSHNMSGGVVLSEHADSPSGLDVIMLIEQPSSLYRPDDITPHA